MATKAPKNPLLYGAAAVAALLAWNHYRKASSGSSGAAAPTYPKLSDIPMTISQTNLYQSAQAASVHPATADQKPTGASSNGRIPPPGTLLYDSPIHLPGT